MRTLEEIEDAYSFLRDPVIGDAIAMIKERDARIETLEAALQKYSCDCNLDDQDNCEVGCWDSASCGYAARAALGEKKDG